jgi:hypothetical protein
LTHRRRRHALSYTLRTSLIQSDRELRLRRGRAHTAETYPTGNSGITASLSYTFDQTGRLNTMTDNIANQEIIQGASYGPANELSGITGGRPDSVSTGTGGTNQANVLAACFGGQH